VHNLVGFCKRYTEKEGFEMKTDSDGTKIYIPSKKKAPADTNWENAPTKIYEIKKNS